MLSEANLNKLRCLSDARERNFYWGEDINKESESELFYGRKDRQIT
jgi:hypothetical protein